MMSKPQSYKMLLSLYSQNVVFDDIVDYVIHIIYNRPKKEKSLLDSRYAMIYVGKGKKKKFASTKKIPPDEQSLFQKTKRAHLVSYSYYNCLQNDFIPMIPEQSGWMIDQGILIPISYFGACLPTVEEYSRAVGEASDKVDSTNEDEEEVSDDDDAERLCSSDDEVESGEESENSDDDI